MRCNLVGRKGDYIQVFTGGVFFPLDPREDEIFIEDIAHALARMGRYTGHTKGDFAYSVAQHCVVVSYHCDPQDALAGLLHDGSEAYSADMARPIKHMPQFSFFREVEDSIQSVVYSRFGLGHLGSQMPTSVKRADDAALAAEVRDMMTPDPDVWGKWLFEITPIEEPMEPWYPKVAEERFLNRFHELYRAA